MMDILEKYYVFCETKLNNQINEELTIKWNIIFDTVVCYDHHRGLYSEQTTTSFSHTRSPLQFTVIQASTEQHMSCRSPPQPRSTKAIQRCETIIYSPKYKTAYSTHPYASKQAQHILRILKKNSSITYCIAPISNITEIDIDHLVCKNAWQCHQEITNLTGSGISSCLLPIEDR